MNCTHRRPIGENKAKAASDVGWIRNHNVHANQYCHSDVSHAGNVQQRLFPGTATLRYMVTGATDMSGLRMKGMRCYGIGAALPTEDTVTHAMHRDNERIKESGLCRFVRYEYEVVAGMAVK